MTSDSEDREALESFEAEMVEAGYDFNPAVLYSNAPLQDPSDVRTTIHINQKRDGLEGEQLEKAKNFLEYLLASPNPKKILHELPIKGHHARSTVVTYLVFQNEDQR